MNDKHGGFAFSQSHPDVAYSDYIGGGMTLRDYFAGQAIFLLRFDSIGDPTGLRLGSNAYKIADAMLAAREVKP
jgi:hypothetical protein